VAFNNPVVAGTTLVIPAIRSANYRAGVSGWTINRDGSSEFQNVTVRGPVIIIDPLTGNVLASVGATGNGAFQNIAVTNDIVLGTVSVAAALSQRAKGIVGMFRTAENNLPIPGVSSSYIDLAWTAWYNDITRLYRIGVSPNRMVNSNLSNTQSLLEQLVVAQTGGFSKVLIMQDQSCTGGRAVNFSAESYFRGSDAANGPMTVKFQAAGDGTGGFQRPALTPNDRDFYIYVEDVGPLPTFSGNTGTPAGAQQFTTQYAFTASRSYDGSGNFIGSPDGDNNIYQGSFSDRSSFASERALGIFPGGTIRTDLSGATIQSCKLWIYVFKSSSSTGFLRISSNTATVIPATFSPGSIASYTFSGLLLPGWNSIDMQANNMLFDIQNNNANSYTFHPSGTPATAYRGFGTTAFKPYIEIVYTK
jgi:hypothetical protein